MAGKRAIVTIEQIEQMMFLLRGHKVVVDADLAHSLRGTNQGMERGCFTE